MSRIMGDYEKEKSKMGKCVLYKARCVRGNARSCGFVVVHISK